MVTMRRVLSRVRRPSDSASKLKVPSISYFRLFRFSSRFDKFLIAFAMISTILSGCSMPYAITLVANAFQNMIDYDKSVKSGSLDISSEVFLAAMDAFSIRYSCIGVILLLGGYFGTAFVNISAINQVFKIRRAYVEAVMNQDFSYYDAHSTGDLASKMTTDLIKLEDGIGDKLTSLVYNCVVAFFCILMAMLKGWKLALLCLVTAPVSFLLVGLTGALAHKLSKKAAIHTSRASSIAEEVFSSVRTVFTFNGQEKEIQRYREPLVLARKIEIKKDLFTGLSMGFLFFSVFCSYALSFYFGIYLIVHEPDKYNADVMFSVFFGVITAFSNLGMLGTIFSSFGSARGAGASIFNLIDNVPSINPLLERGIKPSHLEGNVELKSVSFSYPCRSSLPILQNLSLNVKRGQSVALVGPSGCGKSTIISLISRYYDVQDGSVLVDGMDVRTLSVQWLRFQIGLVEQEPVLFNTTVRENIRYGRDEATYQQIEAAAAMANAHDFIMKLPKGYDTLVGEGGAALSGGQKQRIAIARALVRDPPILLLDEATSALDTASEAKVQVALDKAAEGRTTIIVAHRLSTIRHVNVIYVLSQGQVVEAGTHDELVRQKGVYYNMLAIQDPLAFDITQNEDFYDGPDIAPRTASKQSVISAKSSVSAKYGEELNPKHKLSFWKVVRMNAPEWRSILVGCMASVVIGFSVPLFVLIFGDLFGAMSELDPKKLQDKVMEVVVICVIIGVVMGISSLTETLSFGIAGGYLTERLRLRMFEHILRQDVSYFDDRANNTGALCARLSAEASYVQGATGSRIGVLLQAAGAITLALTFAMVFEYRVGLVALSFFPIILIFAYYENKAAVIESFGTAKTLENSTKIAVEAMLNIRTVASLGREKQILAEYVKELTPALGPAKRMAHFKGVVSGMSRSIFNFINAAALRYGAHFIVSEGAPYKNIIITTQSLQIASNQAQNAFAYAPDIQRGVNAASRAVLLLKTEPKLKDPEDPLVSPFVSAGGAEFKEVVFRYPTRPNVKVLRQLNLVIESGKSLALVGESGCGKSTVIKLLQRYYDPEAGIVALDDIPLTQIRIKEARACFGLVSQEPVLFDRTIKENIAYGDNSREPLMREIIEAAKQANIHEFISKLPDGYDTAIGSRGVQLSGGQKQRVAIARALIRSPQILLLDEATSALDTESEKVVQDALDSAMLGRTCVMIAHRLSTVRNADVICVFKHGRVVETGTHHQLMEAKGYYYDLNMRNHHA